MEELAREISRTRGLKFRATPEGYVLELCRHKSPFVRCLQITVGELCEVHRITRQAVMDNIHLRQPMLDKPRGTKITPKVPERSELVGRFSTEELTAGLLRRLVEKEFPSSVQPD